MARPDMFCQYSVGVMVKRVSGYKNFGNVVFCFFLDRSDGLGSADGWAGLSRPQCVCHSSGGR